MVLGDFREEIAGRGGKGFGVGLALVHWER